ncbi:hypothetical protein SJR91_19405, partial [Aeromonas caviae]|uniref:hypothetical protein n=1 Tax=Aeromonas caviae TaxID=648 RepID=UPI0029D7B6BA
RKAAMNQKKSPTGSTASRFIPFRGEGKNSRKWGRAGAAIANRGQWLPAQMNRGFGQVTHRNCG